MALGWNEIKDRALKFSKEWANTCNEETDAKPKSEDIHDEKDFPSIVVKLNFISSVGSALMCIAYIPWGIKELQRKY